MKLGDKLKNKQTNIIYEVVGINRVGYIVEPINHTNDIPIIIYFQEIDKDFRIIKFIEEGGNIIK